MIAEECIHANNTECIEDRKNECVTETMDHYFDACYTFVFGNTNTRDVRAIKVRDAINSLKVDSMTIDEMNKVLSDPEIWL